MPLGQSIGSGGSGITGIVKMDPPEKDADEEKDGLGKKLKELLQDVFGRDGDYGGIGSPPGGGSPGGGLPGWGSGKPGWMTPGSGIGGGPGLTPGGSLPKLGSPGSPVFPDTPERPKRPVGTAPVLEGVLLPDWDDVKKKWDEARKAAEDALNEAAKQAEELRKWLEKIAPEIGDAGVPLPKDANLRKCSNAEYQDICTLCVNAAYESGHGRSDHNQAWYNYCSENHYGQTFQVCKDFALGGDINQKVGWCHNAWL